MTSDLLGCVVIWVCLVFWGYAFGSELLAGFQPYLDVTFEAAVLRLA